MTKSKIILIFILIVLIFRCTIKTKETTPIISLLNLEKGELSLIDIVKEIKYLKLDNAPPVQRILNVTKSDTIYFVNTLNGLFAYNNKGRFLYEIGKKGKGPGEYNNAYDITIDNKSKHIYVLGYKIVYVYNFYGKFLFSFKTYNDKHFNRIIYSDSKLYFPAAYDVAERLDYQWVITDENGKLIGLKKNSKNDVKIRVSLKTNICFEEENKLYYWNQLNDTIFYIDDKIGQPAYLFSNDKYRISAADLEKEETFRNKSLWNLLSVLGTSKYLILEYLNIKDKAKLYSVYDKKSDRFYELNRLTLGNEMALVNPVDNGPLFRPKTKISGDNGEWFIDWVDAYQLIAYVDSEAFKNSTPKYPEKKKELEQLANSLGENDNPVLMLVKLKE